MRRRGLLWLLAGASIAACKRGDPDDGTTPQPNALPPLTLRDDTPDLLLTYLDDRGDFHTTQRIEEIPPAHRNPVRVVVVTREEGASTSLFYVADLTQKRPDGTYVVTSMSRARWEALAEQRRGPAVAAPAPPPASAPPPGPGAPAPAPGQAAIIIYGASWCEPCHDAQDHLKRRRIAFTYRDIEADPVAHKEMLEKVERAGARKGPIPVIDVNGRILVGFNPSALDAAIGAAGRDRTAL